MVRWSICRIDYISVRLSSTFIYHHLPTNSRCTFQYWLFLLTASFNTSKSWLLCSWPGSNWRLLRQLCRFGGLVPATPQWLGGGSGHFLGDDRHSTRFTSYDFGSTLRMFHSLGQFDGAFTLVVKSKYHRHRRRLCRHHHHHHQRRQQHHFPQ